MSARLLERQPIAGTAAAIGGTSAILSSVLDSEVQLALWQRARPPALDWIDTLDWDEIDDIDAELSAPDWTAEISSVLHEAGYPQSPDGDALARELAVCATEFASLMRCDQLNMRLEVIETDACRKFHMDHVTARLLMPLYGPGTQWIDTAHGSDAPINQLHVGDVAIFKGRLSVEQPSILHRSPPVAASGETRLLFVLNPPDTRAFPPESSPA